MVKRFAEIAFERYEWAVKDLSEKDIDWRPMEETNSIRWILTHLSQQWNVMMPRILKQNPEYKPRDWPEDYVNNVSFSFDRIMSDMEKGKSVVTNGLKNLTLEELEAEIPLWAGTRKRQYGILMLLSEIFHHAGQIAYLKGAIERRRQTDEHFLT